jgi:hypothetical protein
MSSNNPDFNIVKNLRTIEWIKAELVAGMGTLFKALIKNNQELLQDALAGLVISCYFLARRLGISFTKLDENIRSKLQSQVMQEHEIEQWYGDVTNLENYLKDRNRY